MIRTISSAINRFFPAALIAFGVVGCATPGDKEGGWTSAMPSIPFLSQKGAKATLISGLRPGPYDKSSMAIGEEKDLAQRRGEGLGFVRSEPLDQYLTQIRNKLIAASGITGVPGQVVVLANPSYAAYSSPDGNIGLSMGWVHHLESEDEVAAILAHEISHVLLRHHSSDIVSAMQRKGQALHEIGVAGKMALSKAKTVDKSDSRDLTNVELVVYATDKLVMPAWNRDQEREADLLGVDLMVRAGYDLGATSSMLEKFQAWEKQNKESEDAFWEKTKETARKDLGQAIRQTVVGAIERVSASHPKTEERIDDLAGYLGRHYTDAKSTEPKIASWKAINARPEVSQVMRNYRLAFSAKKLLDQHKGQEAYADAKAAATGRTATDAYPNWVLAKSAASLGRSKEAIDALGRAVKANEPIPQIYDELIFTHEQAGNIAAALDWNDKASAVFGESPRWTPAKIRLLRKAGRTAEADALTLKCSVDTPDWRRLCQEANGITVAGVQAKPGPTPPASSPAVPRSTPSLPGVIPGVPRPSPPR